MRPIRWFALLLLALGFMASAQAEEPQSGKRVALVIGNGAYRSVERLRNPVNDANLIAATLKELGFTLVGGGPQTDLDKPALMQAVQAFGRALAGAEVALFYYSGHGLQVGGVNWLVPIDANPTRSQDLDFQMVDADLVLHQMDGVGTRLNIVILDACRNNPFAVRGLRSMGAGLAEMRAPEGTLISYATQPGAVARDGDGSNSPYSQALAATMRKPGLDVFRTFNQVGLAVKRATGGEQQPWVSNSPIDGDFEFAGLVPQAMPVAPPPPPQLPAQPEPAPKSVAPCSSSGKSIRPYPPNGGGCGPEEQITPAPGPAVAPPVVAPPAAAPPAAAHPAVAHPALARPPPRPTASAERARPVRSGRCADLTARAQLGEPLGAADRVAMAGCL